MKFLVGIPVFNEEKRVRKVIEEARQYADDLAVVNDGSTDSTHRIVEPLSAQGLIRHLINHPFNQGYGKSLIDLFTLARQAEYECLITMDGDGQHPPSSIPGFIASLEGYDIISGTRYPSGWSSPGDPPPPDRLNINKQITSRINQITRYGLTDAFCGLKTYGRRAIELLRPVEPGYGMPLELWILAAQEGLKVRELPVLRLYPEKSRSFGARLDGPGERLAYYEQVIERTLARTSHESIRDS